MIIGWASSRSTYSLQLFQSCLWSQYEGQPTACPFECFWMDVIEFLVWLSEDEVCDGGKISHSFTFFLCVCFLQRPCFC